MKDLTIIEKEIIEVEVEKSRLNREKAMLVLNKSLFIYFLFLFVAIIGFINSFISKNMLNILIVVGLIVLVIGSVPYVQTMHSEELKLNNIIDELRRKARK